MSKKYQFLPLNESKISREKWDIFVEQSNGGSIFHRLDFLSYHGDRFTGNESHLVILKGDSLFGVLPLGIFFENGKKIAKSPYGGSYGGPVFLKNLSYNESLQCNKDLLAYFKKAGIQKIIITLPIQQAYNKYCETFRLGLYETGYRLRNRDISSVVDLRFPWDKLKANFKSKARNMVRKAENNGLEIISDADLEIFWKVLAKTFEKHKTDPTHTQDELKALKNTFPSRIYFDVATYRNEPVSGSGYFEINKNLSSSFYFANTPDFQHLQGLSLLIYHGLKQSKEKGFKFFDFGTSSASMKGRNNIFRFKESFGSVGAFRDTYVWEQNPVGI